MLRNAIAHLTVKMGVKNTQEASLTWSMLDWCSIPKKTGRSSLPDTVNIQAIMSSGMAHFVEV
jgi:hypothetical protein